MERLTAEQEFHDRQARARAGTFSHHPDELLVNDEAYLDHETWIRPAFAQLGDLRGLQVLDYGCGHGMAAVVLSRLGARVTAFDLSGGYLAEARRRAHANEARISFVQANGEHLPFANASFDRVWGNAILHHLDLTKAGLELRRIMRPGGRAIFCEPWGENPILNWARRRLLYPGKARTPDEKPLSREQVHRLRKIFPGVEMQGFQLLSMARRVIHAARIRAGLDWCDRQLLGRIPGLQRFCRYFVLTLHP